MPHTRKATRPIKTGSGIFLPGPQTKNETQVLSYGLKHSVTPKRKLTDDIVSSVESVLARQRELPESTKADIRSRIASTLQSGSLTHCNLTKDELNALRRLRNDKDIVILPADKGRVTVVMDKMDSLVNENQTYEPLNRNHKPALQRRLNGKLLDLKKTETIDIQLHYRLRCRVPQSAKLYGLPKLHKPNIPMQPIVLFCGLVGCWRRSFGLWFRDSSYIPESGSSKNSWTDFSSQDCGNVFLVLSFC